MADFVNPTTLDLVESASSMPSPWVVCTRAQLEAWQLFPLIYRKWVTDHIEEMTAGEKATKDAAILTAARDGTTARLDQVESVERAVLLTILDEFNAHAAKIKGILDAIDASTTYATLKTNIAAVADYPQRTTAQLRASVRGKLGS